MEINAIREGLIRYISHAPDEMLKALQTLVEGNLETDALVELTDEQSGILDEEDALHLAGKTKSHTWDEANQIIRGEKNNE